MQSFYICPGLNTNETSTGMNITVAKRKRALLLHYAGPDVDEIFDTLPNTGEDRAYERRSQK